MTDHHGPVRSCEFPAGHSNILKSAESRMRTAREAKLVHTNELIDLQLVPHVASNCLGNNQSGPKSSCGVIQ